MNKFILCVMNRRNKTEAELNENRIAAIASYVAADSYAGNAGTNAATCAANAACTAANAAAAAYYAAYNSDNRIECHINMYFEISGENRADYEKELD